MELAQWCETWLGAKPGRELFRTGHLSVVRGLELGDGRRVVVKCRVAGWEHGEDGVWPWPDDLDADLNASPGPDWLDDLGRRVRARLTGTRLPPVVGHGDFESQNLRWRGGELAAVHDWDSVVALPEPAVAGAAAAVFTETGRSAVRATVEESARFLECYVRARGLRWGPEEWGVAWAAGLWVRAFNAKKAVVAGAGRDALGQLAAQAEARLHLMGPL
ncbi:phosphotransferase [[Actinomadura] parvosata]|uniref:phosphotransferase n=1 Tax=[Actinomadura] parvosata TaxID=1955412 RepID=UPI00406D01DC